MLRGHINTLVRIVQGKRWTDIDLPAVLTSGNPFCPLAIIMLARQHEINKQFTSTVTRARGCRHTAQLSKACGLMMARALPSILPEFKMPTIEIIFLLLS